MKRKTPSPLVTTLHFLQISLVERSRSVTVAPGMGRPVASRTVPSMAPACAFFCCAMRCCGCCGTSTNEETYARELPFVTVLSGTDFVMLASVQRLTRKKLATRQRYTRVLSGTRFRRMRDAGSILVVLTAVRSCWCYKAHRLGSTDASRGASVFANALSELLRYRDIFGFVRWLSQ